MKAREQSVTRDAWDALVEAASALADAAANQGMRLRASRRWRVLELSYVEGLELTDRWTDIFEPVRRRRLWGTRWENVQSVDQAAALIAGFLRDRPDREGTRDC
jgi:hypothetical protein